MVKEQAINGITWTSAASLLGNLLQFLQLVLVARFISAADYGLMSVTVLITYFAQLAGDMGMSSAIIYKKDISKQAFSALFWLSLLFCWMIFGILILSAGWLAVFFKQPELKNLIRLGSVLFIFLPVQLQYQSLLRKNLAFKKIALADLFSRLLALVTAAWLAWAGWGVYALVYAVLVSTVTAGALYFYSGRRYMLPAFSFKRAGTKDLMRFALYQTGNELLTYLNFHADTLLLARVTGIDAVGLYTFAKNLAMKPTQLVNPAITQVAFPLLAKVSDDTGTVKNIYLKMTRYLSAVNFLIYPYLAASSASVIGLFFGKTWLPAATVFQWLSLFYMVRSVYNPSGALAGATGTVRRLFYWNLLLLLVIPLVVFLSLGKGIDKVAAALCGVMVLLYVPMWRYIIFPACGASFTEYWKAIKIPLLHSALIFALVSACNLFYLKTELLQLLLNTAVWLLSCLLLIRFGNKEFYRQAMALASGSAKSK